MTRPSFEVVLDECIEDLRNGRRSLDECLARWPQHAAALDPLLRTAVAARHLSLPAQSASGRSRADFMRAVRNTPQQSRRRPLGRALEGLRALVVRSGLVLVPAAVAVAFAMLLVFPGSTPRAEASSVLTVFSGGVEVERNGAWTPLTDGQSVTTGARLRTDGDGRALLTFRDGSTVALDPRSEVLVEQATTEGPRRIVLRQAAGRLLHQVIPDDRSDALFRVHTPTATVSAQGTVFETVITDGATEVSTADGAVEVVAGTQRLAVAHGEAATAAREQVRAVAPGARAAASAALVVDAPFVASVIGPDGRATGAFPSGIVYQQIPGAFSSDPLQGPQRIQFTDVRPGEYTLLLRRLGEGGGEVRLSTAATEQSVVVGADGDVLALRLVITSAGGSLSVRPVEISAAVALRVEAVQQERVVITQRAQERAEQLKARLTPTRPAAAATPASGTATATATTTATASATGAARPAAPPVSGTPERTSTAPPVRPTGTVRPQNTPQVQPTRPAVTVVPVKPRPVIITPTATPTELPSPKPAREVEGILDRVLPGRAR